MGLYDSYRLSQSQLVKQPAGSAINDFVKVASTLQDRYDTAVGIADEMDRQLQNVPVRAEDRPAFEQMKQKYKAGLTDLAQKGDYENAMRPLTNLAKGFTGEYATFANEIAKEQAYDKQLQEYFEKGIIKDANNLARYKAASKKMSSGLQLDPATGRYVGGFQGLQPAKEIDFNEVSNKLLQHINADSQFRASLGISGDYHMKSIEELKKLGPEKIQQAFQAYASVDPEYKGYVQSMQKLRAAEIPDDIVDRLPAEQQATIRDRAIEVGMTGNQYMKAAAAQEEAKNIYSGLLGMGMKAVYQDSKIDYDFGPLTEAARKKDEEVSMFPGLGGHTAPAVSTSGTALSNGQPTASVWDRVTNSVVGALFTAPLTPGLAGAAERAVAFGTSGTTKLPNDTRVTASQHRILQPAATYYAKQRGSSTPNAEDWTAAQQDMKNRAGFNIGTEVITNPKELKALDKIMGSSDLFNAFPTRALVDGRWVEASGLGDMAKKLGIKGTAEQLYKSMRVAGAVSPNNPAVKGGLKVSVPKDPENVQKGTIDLIVEIDPSQYMEAPKATTSKIVHEISKQYYDLKQEGTVGGYKWNYNRSTHAIDLKDSKGNQLQSIPAPQIVE